MMFPVPLPPPFPLFCQFSVGFMQQHLNGSNNKRRSDEGNDEGSQRREELMDWLNGLPLSKPCKNLDRDFTDAVLVVEVIGHFLPRYVISLSAFAHVHSVALKKYNWESLDKVVLRHLGIRLGQDTIESLARGQEGAFEAFLPLLRTKINETLELGRFRPSSRSRPSSRGGSQVHLDQIGGTTSHQQRDEWNGKTAKGGGQIPVLDEMDRDQLIERLYAKVRAQESQLARKDEQIEMLTRRVNKLVEMICDGKMQKSDGKDKNGHRDEQMMLNNDFD